MDVLRPAWQSGPQAAHTARNLLPAPRHSTTIMIHELRSAIAPFARPLAVLVLTRLAAPALAQEPPNPAAEPNVAPPAAAWSDAQQRGVTFLLQHQTDGVFRIPHGTRSVADAGFTALALAALQSKPEAARSAAERDAVAKGCAWLLTQQNEDGSFGRNVPNYTTCAVVMALARWDRERSAAALQRAQRFLLALQHCEANGSSPADVEFGGVGYGSKGERSDLSNLQFAIGALRETGLATDHDAFARAVVFLQRTQNLSSHNDLTGKLVVRGSDGAAAKLATGDDGGAVYYPGESPAGHVEHPNGTVTPRSYGSMTYALLKTYLLCGLPKDDPRVAAAVRWIAANWTLDENPGADPRLGEKARYQGLFYHYLLLAQALDTAGLATVPGPATVGGPAAPTATPMERDWRRLLRLHLIAMQNPDGSWRNDRNDRWYEGMPILCTCYALLALERCH